MLTSCFILAVSALTSSQANTVELTVIDTKLIEAFKSLSQLNPQLSHSKTRSLKDNDCNYFAVYFS